MSDENEEEHEYTFYPVNADTMRQPTNLELATLIHMEGQHVIALVNLMLLGNNLLTEEDEAIEGVRVHQAAAEAVSDWWMNLVIDDSNVQHFSDSDLDDSEGEW